MKKVIEYCPFCEDEVELDAVLTIQTCPNCGKKIIPCCLCEGCKSNCALDDACRSENYPTIKEGDLVKWNDPAIDDFELNERELQKKRIFKVIKFINEDMVLIADDFGEGEVYVNELEKIGS